MRSTRKPFSMWLAGLVLMMTSLACSLVLSSPSEGAAPEPTFSADGGEPGEPAAEEPPAPEATLIPIIEATFLPPPVALPTPTTAVQAQPQPAILESRRLTLEFPPVMRTGDATRIRLQLEVDDQGNVIPTAMVDGNVVTGEVVEIPNLYETHNVIAEARLDMAGMEVQPPGTISEPLLQGQAVIFYWSVRPNESGNYEGTAWLHLRFLPKGGGEESRVPVSVQFIEIEAKSFLGVIPGSTARGLGTLGSVVGSVLGFPFASDLVKWLWSRRKQK